MLPYALCISGLSMSYYYYRIDLHRLLLSDFHSNLSLSSTFLSRLCFILIFAIGSTFCAQVPPPSSRSATRSSKSLFFRLPIRSWRVPSDYRGIGVFDFSPPDDLKILSFFKVPMRRANFSFPSFRPRAVPAFLRYVAMGI